MATDRLRLRWYDAVMLAQVTFLSFERSAKKDGQDPKPSPLFSLASQYANNGFWVTPTRFIPGHRMIDVEVLMEHGEDQAHG